MTNLLGKVLNHYRPGCVVEGETSQVQCFFHGPDETYSARYYADTDSYYCFACLVSAGHAAWFVAQMEDISYLEAVKWLEKKYNITLSTARSDNRGLADAYKNLIVKLVTEKQPKQFNKIYYQMDQAVLEQDLKKLREIFNGLTKTRV